MNSQKINMYASKWTPKHYGEKEGEGGEGENEKEANSLFQTLGEKTRCNNFPGIPPCSLGWVPRRKLPEILTFSI